MAVLALDHNYDLAFEDTAKTSQYVIGETAPITASVEVLCVFMLASSSAYQLLTPSGWTLRVIRPDHGSLPRKWHLFTREAGTGTSTVDLAWTVSSTSTMRRIGAWWAALSDVSLVDFVGEAAEGSVSPYAGVTAPLVAFSGERASGLFVGHLSSFSGTPRMTAPAGMDGTDVQVPVLSEAGVATDEYIQRVLGWFDDVSEIPAGEFGADPSGSAAVALGAVMLFSYEPFSVARASQSPLDRYRSSISADAGSLLATTRAVPFDTSHSIAFSPAAELEQETLYPFHEATSVQSGTADVLFYPRARQSLSGPVEYDGVTLLTLMERVYPAQILTTTEDAGIPNTGGGSTGAPGASAQGIIDYVFTQWAAEFSWFSFKPVPDLRLRNVAVTGDWDGVLALRTTVLRDTVVRVLQSPTSPRSMRAMLEGLLSPFPGTQFFMDSDGDLVIRPVYGPDADAEPYKVLDEGDVVTISIGEPSVDQIANRATVSLRQFKQANDVSVIEPAFLQVASNSMRDTGSLPGPPVTDYLITAPTDRLDLSTPDAGFGGWRSIPLGEGIVLGNEPIAFEDSGGLLITAAVNTYDSDGNLQEAWSSPGDLTVEVFNTVPLDGSTVLAFGVRRGASYSGNSYYGRWNARWNASTQTVEVQWAGGGLEVNTAFPGTLRVGQMSVTINGVSRAWAEGASLSATFGVTGDFVPGPADTNALDASVTAFGVVEERFAIEGYGNLAVETLERIAEAYVVQNLTPRATRELALTWKGAVGVEFDDRGRLVGFPTDGEGFLIGRRYADDFVANAGGVTVTIEETVPGSPGTIDFDTVYLLLDGGELWLNDDASASPPA